MTGSPLGMDGGCEHGSVPNYDDLPDFHAVSPWESTGEQTEPDKSSNEQVLERYECRDCGASEWVTV